MQALIVSLPNEQCFGVIKSTPPEKIYSIGILEAIMNNIH